MKKRYMMAFLLILFVLDIATLRSRRNGLELAMNSIVPSRSPSVYLLSWNFLFPSYLVSFIHYYYSSHHHYSRLYWLTRHVLIFYSDNFLVLVSMTFLIAGLAIISFIHFLTFGHSWSIYSLPRMIRSAEVFHCRKAISATLMRPPTSHPLPFAIAPSSTFNTRRVSFWYRSTTSSGLPSPFLMNHTAWP